VLLSTIHEALTAFKDKEGWRKLMLNGMRKDFSWTASAREYVRVYEKLVPPKTPPSAEKALELSRA
jgi:starch synthase